MKKYTGKIPVLGIGIVLAICILAELYHNLPLLRLPAESRGEYPLQYQVQTLENMEWTTEGYRLEDEAKSGKITWEFDPLYVDKFRYSINSTGLFGATITVTTEDRYGNYEEKSYSDNSPVVVPESIVHLHGKISKLTIEVSEPRLTGNRQDLTISAPTVVNTVTVNKHRIAILFLLGMMVVLLIRFRSLFWKKPEFGFALVALAVGFSMLLVLPTNKVGWDEEAHLRAAFQLAAKVKPDAVPGVIAGQMAISEYSWPENQPGTEEESKLLDLTQDTIFENYPDDAPYYGRFRGFATAGTVFQAAAIVVARVFHLPWRAYYFLGRLVNLLVYVFVMFWVIRILPVGKRITMFISLMPTSILLATTFTYDVVVYAFILLGMAILLREWFREDRKVDDRMLILACVFFIWGCLSKQIYAPLILILWLIPADRFHSRKQMWIWRGLSVLVMLGVLGTMALATLLGNYGGGDSRGGSNVSNGSQMQLILSHPVAYAVLLMKHLLSTFTEYTLGASVFGQMGHLPAAGFQYLIPISAVAVLMTDQENTEKFKIRDRIVMFVICGGIAALIWTALYVQFNPVGATTIGGVQARYYRPFLPILYMVFGNRLLQIRTDQKYLNGAVLGVSALIMSVTVLQLFALYCS